MKPTLIITRPAPDGARFAAAFGDLPVILSPLQRIDPVPATCDADEVIFTSTNGVLEAARLGLNTGRAWCVGDRTAQMARDAGFDAVSAQGNVEDLLRLILSDPPRMRLAHIRGKDARGDVAPRLNAAGVACADCIAYVQTPVPLHPDAIAAINGADPVIIPLFSPRAAVLLLENAVLGPHITCVAISTAVADVLGGVSVVTADQPNAEAMKTAVTSVIATL